MGSITICGGRKASEPSLSPGPCSWSRLAGVTFPSPGPMLFAGCFRREARAAKPSAATPSRARVEGSGTTPIVTLTDRSVPKRLRPRPSQCRQQLFPTERLGTRSGSRPACDSGRRGQHGSSPMVPHDPLRRGRRPNRQPRRLCHSIFANYYFVWRPKCKLPILMKPPGRKNLPHSSSPVRPPHKSHPAKRP